MKLIIDIPEDDYELVQKYIYPQRVFYELVHGTPISDNSTNGDIQKALYPNTSVLIDEVAGIVCYESDYDEFEMRCSLDWWNAPYQKGGKE